MKIPVPGFQGYEIDKEGNCFSKRGILKPEIKKDGYVRVTLYKKGKGVRWYVHRLVAFVFIGEVKGKQVNHKNKCRQDNRLVNLEIVTPLENVAHRDIYCPF